MPKTKVLLYSKRDNEVDEYAKLLTDSNLELDLFICKTEEDINSCISDVEIIFGVHLPPESYKKAKNLLWIQSMWAGVESLISISLPTQVQITKPWGVFGKYLSHYVFGNLLALRINLLGARKSQSEHNWQPYQLELLQGQCMGIAGMGNIANSIAQVAKTFEMKVWALNSDGRPHYLADKSFSPKEIIDFVSGVDILVLVLPATSKTKKIFNKDLLKHMKKTAVLINVGRGILIDDQALIEILEEQKIAAAILDVFQEEPLPKEHPYWRLPNCIVTPHVGGPSLPADITACFVENLKLYRQGKPLLGLIDRERGY